MSVDIAERSGAIVFQVRVVPRARREEIEGEHAGALKVRLTAPPVEGAANDALRQLLAARLNVSMAAVKIVGGEKSRTKRVSVQGATRAQVAALFQAAKK